MALTPKGRKIMKAMKKHYGPKRGERVFYASACKGTIKGVTTKPVCKRRRGKVGKSRRRRRR